MKVAQSKLVILIEWSKSSECFDLWRTTIWSYLPLSNYAKGSNKIMDLEMISHLGVLISKEQQWEVISLYQNYAKGGHKDIVPWGPKGHHLIISLL